jgi:hypothetical protein
LKEENFDLKLRIYMLEEKLADSESHKLNSQLQSVLKNSMYNSEDSESDMDDGDCSNSSNMQSKSPESLDVKGNEKEDNNDNLHSTDKYFQRNNYDSDQSEKDTISVS